VEASTTIVPPDGSGVPNASVAVIGLIETRPLRQSVSKINAKVDAGPMTPEQVGRERNVALFRQFVAGLTAVGIEPE
jgi:hypothetical protein